MGYIKNINIIILVIICLVIFNTSGFSKNFSLPVELDLSILKVINTDEDFFKLEIIPFQDIVKDPDNVNIISLNIDRNKVLNTKEKFLVYTVTFPVEYKDKVLLSTLSTQNLNKVTNNFEKVNIYNGIYLPGDQKIRLDYKTTSIIPIFVPVLIQKFKKDDSLTQKEINSLKDAEKIITNSPHIDQVAEYVSNVIMQNFKKGDTENNQYIPSFEELSQNKEFKNILIDAQKDIMRANLILMDLTK